jgi:transposase
LAAGADLKVIADQLGHSPGLTAVGAAAILAETGDPRRYENSSSLVKHAGLSPSDNTSGAFEGLSRISRRGRPGLRLAAWCHPPAAWDQVEGFSAMSMGPPGRQ